MAATKGKDKWEKYFKGKEIETFVKADSKSTKNNNYVYDIIGNKTNKRLEHGHPIVVKETDIYYESGPYQNKILIEYDRDEIGYIHIDCIQKIKKISINLKPSSPIFNFDNTEKNIKQYIDTLINCINSDESEMLSESEKQYLIDLINSAHQSAKTGKIIKPKNIRLSDGFAKKVSTEFSELICPLYALSLLKKTEMGDFIPQNINDNRLKIKIPNDSVALYDFEILSDKRCFKVSVKGGRISQEASIDDLFGKVNLIKFNTLFQKNKLIVSASQKQKYGVFESIVANKVMVGSGQANALMAVAQIYRSNVSSKMKYELEKEIFDYYKFDDRKEKAIVIDWFRSLRKKYTGKEKISSTTKNMQHIEMVQKWLKYVKDNRSIKKLSKFDTDSPNDYIIWYASYACELALQRHSGVNKTKKMVDGTNSNFKNFIVEKFLEENKIILQSFAVKLNGDIETKISIKKEDLKEWFSIRSKNSFGNYTDKIGIDPVGRNK